MVSYHSKEKCQPLFITIEGLDGSGKSSQVMAITSWFEYLFGWEAVHRLHDPCHTGLASKLGELLSSEVWPMKSETRTLLHLAASSQLLELIKSLNNNGKHVICDRFYDSTIAYQGFGNLMNVDFIQHGISFYGGYAHVPDLTIYLKVSKETAAQRRRPREQDYLDSMYENKFDNIATGYDRIAGADRNRVVIVDGERSHAQVLSDCKEAIVHCLRNQRRNWLTEFETEFGPLVELP